MRALTAGASGVATLMAGATTIHFGERAASQSIDGDVGVDANNHAPLSLVRSDVIAYNVAASPTPLDASSWPPSTQTYNATRRGVEVDLGEKIYFLSGEPRTANCQADINGTYGKWTIGFAQANCPTRDDDAPHRQASYNTYSFSQDPEHVYLERPPVDSMARFCTNVTGWNAVEQREIPLRGALVQPLSVTPFVYEEVCTVPVSSTPTEAFAPAAEVSPAPTDASVSNTSVPREVEVPRDVASTGVTLYALAATGTVVGLAVCVYKHLGSAERFTREPAAVELAQVEPAPAPADLEAA